MLDRGKIPNYQEDIRDGVPQGSALVPVLYLFSTNQPIPKTLNTTIATLAYDTALFAMGDFATETSTKLDRVANKVGLWACE